MIRELDDDSRRHLEVFCCRTRGVGRVRWRTPASTIYIDWPSFHLWLDCILQRNWWQMDWGYDHLMATALLRCSRDWRNKVFSSALVSRLLCTTASTWLNEEAYDVATEGEMQAEENVQVRSRCPAAFTARSCLDGGSCWRLDGGEGR